MTNTFQNHLDHFFEKLLYYRHISSRNNQIFENEIKSYSSKKAMIHLASSLYISDWTDFTNKGGEINFYTGTYLETITENYEAEIKRIYSRQLCLLYAQSFEAFERFLKNCLFDRISRDNIIREFAISLLHKNHQPLITRDKMPGGDKLFKILKKSGGKSFKTFTLKNNKNIKFAELWKILSEVRHAITHNESRIDLELLNKSSHHNEIFTFLFNSSDTSKNSLLVELEYKKFEKLIKRFSEFAYQIFKLLSIEEGLKWQTH